MKELFEELARAEGVERENLERELRAVVKRLRAGEYARTDFIARNAFDVPRRTREFMIYMNGWARHARTWMSLLRAIPLERVRTVQDLCPGWAPKVEIALAHLGFGGEVVLVDRDREAAQRIVDFMPIFAPKYALSIATEDLFAPATAQAELVTANHAIDDLLLDADVYEDEAKLVEAHAKLEASEGLAGRIASAFAARVAPGGFLAIAQYPSYIESLVELGRGAEVPRALFAAVVRDLRANGFDGVPFTLEADATFDSRSAVVLRRS